MFSSNFRSRFVRLLEPTTLSRAQKDLILARYVEMVAGAEKVYNYTCVAHLFLTNLITVAGVLIAALSPLEKLNWIGEGGSMAIFWLVWSLAISLTLANKWIYAFNIHKKYVLNIIILEKLYGEGWTFLAGIDRYKKCNTDDERFQLFCSRIEKIKLKSLESMPEMESNESAAASVLAAGSSTDKSAVRDKLIDSPNGAAPCNKSCNNSYDIPCSVTIDMPATDQDNIASGSDI